MRKIRRPKAAPKLAPFEIPRPVVRKELLLFSTGNRVTVLLMDESRRVSRLLGHIVTMATLIVGAFQHVFELDN